jgi:hypothetical protein
LKVEISIFQDMALSIRSDVHEQNQFTAICGRHAYYLAALGTVAQRKLLLLSSSAMYDTGAVALPPSRSNP